MSFEIYIYFDIFKLIGRYVRLKFNYVLYIFNNGMILLFLRNYMKRIKCSYI